MIKRQVSYPDAHEKDVEIKGYKNDAFDNGIVIEEETGKTTPDIFDVGSKVDELPRPKLTYSQSVDVQKLYRTLSNISVGIVADLPASNSIKHQKFDKSNSAQTKPEHQTVGK